MSKKVLLSFSLLLLGVPAGYRESFRGTCFITQPVGRATYCQSKACYSWNIVRKISSYNLPDRTVDVSVLVLKSEWFLTHQYLSMICNIWKSICFFILIIIETIFQERTDQVRAEYEKILQQKLGEQYDAFVRLVLSQYFPPNIFLLISRMN